VFTQRRGDVTQGRATYAHGAGAIVESIVMSRAMCAHGAGAIVEYRRSSAGASVFVRVDNIGVKTEQISLVG
jgi:hypothetical protein